MFNLLAAGTPLTTVILVFGIVVIVMSVFLIIAVLMQQGKQHNISGTIAGAADTFFGKTKGSTISKKLSVLTSVVAIIFVLLVLGSYIVATKGDTVDEEETTSVTQTVDTSESETAAAAEGETAETNDTAEAAGETAGAETETETEAETNAEANE